MLSSRLIQLSAICVASIALFGSVAAAAQTAGTVPAATPVTAAGKLPGQQERLRRLLAERVVRVTVKPFMDISTMIEERLTQCCVHVGTKSEADAHQCAPFCAVQAWPELARQRLSTATTRRELRLPRASGVRS